jgi:hypothetical protein
MCAAGGALLWKVVIEVCAAFIAALISVEDQVFEPWNWTNIRLIDTQPKA